MKKTFTIGQLNGMAWENAVANVGFVLGKKERVHALWSWYHICEVASKLGVLFDIDGNIVTNPR